MWRMDMPLHDAAHVREAIIRIGMGQVKFRDELEFATACGRLHVAALKHNVITTGIVEIVHHIESRTDEQLLKLWRLCIEQTETADHGTIACVRDEIARREDLCAAADVVAQMGTHVEAVEVYRRSRRSRLEAPAWKQSTFYAVGNVVVTGYGYGTVYRCTEAGISSPSGPGPRGTGSAVRDGSVTWSLT
jgi:hypothetical protein